MSLPWDAPEVSETVFRSRAGVEFQVGSSCPSTTPAARTCGRATVRAIGGLVIPEFRR